MNSIPDIAITKEQISDLPLVSFPGKITVVETHDQAVAALAELSAAKMVGFDTETKPSFKKGQTNTVSLIQISTDHHCFLFRLKKLGFIDPLRAFMEDASVVKVGLSLRDDFHVLHRISKFEPAGFIDLQDLVHDFSIHDISLQKVYAIIFGQRISKSQRLSNWEAPQLTPSQQSYASIDAWACLKIYKQLSQGLFDPDKSPYHVTQEDTP